MCFVTTTKGAQTPQDHVSLLGASKESLSVSPQKRRRRELSFHAYAGTSKVRHPLGPSISRVRVCQSRVPKTTLPVLYQKVVDVAIFTRNLSTGDNAIFGHHEARGRRHVCSVLHFRVKKRLPKSRTVTYRSHEGRHSKGCASLVKHYQV